MIEIHDIGWAVQQLKQGKCVRRAHWNDPNTPHGKIYTRAIILDDRRDNDIILLRKRNPDCPIKIVLTSTVWIPSVKDVLSTDWETVEPEDI